MCFGIHSMFSSAEKQTLKQIIPMSTNQKTLQTTLRQLLVIFAVSNYEVVTSFSASMSRNCFMRISSGMMARSRAAFTSASIAASFPMLICCTSDLLSSLFSVPPPPPPLPAAAAAAAAVPVPAAAAAAGVSPFWSGLHSQTPVVFSKYA